MSHIEQGILYIVKGKKKNLVVDRSVMEEEERTPSPVLYVRIRAFFSPVPLILERKKVVKEVTFCLGAVELFVTRSHGR